MNSVKSIIPNFESLTDNSRIDILLYGDSRFDENMSHLQHGHFDPEGGYFLNKRLIEEHDTNYVLQGII